MRVVPAFLPVKSGATGSGYVLSATVSAMPQPGGPLHVRGLRVALPDGRVLIDGIDLSVGAGEVIVLLGGSGSIAHSPSAERR